MAPLLQGDQGAGGQVIEQRGRLLPGQPQQPPHSFGGAALQQQLQGCGAEQALEALGHPLPQGVGDQRRVAGGGEPHPLDRIEGALAGRIEFPQLLQFLAEQLKPHRQLGADRKEVDDVAAAAPGALLLDGRDPLVPEPRQGVAQLLEVQRVATPQGEAAVGQHLRGGQMGLQGPFGSHDRQPLAAGLRIEQFGEHLQLAPGDLAGGIKRVVGRALAGGVELAALPAHQLQQRRPAARLLQAGHHHQQRRLGHARQGTADQGPAGPAGAPQP